jgi:hypothetical protein
MPYQTLTSMKWDELGLDLSLWNRRMPVGTSGGVGGRGPVNYRSPPTRFWIPHFICDVDFLRDFFTSILCQTAFLVHTI